jgi:hypothetical protein
MRGIATRVAAGLVCGLLAGGCAAVPTPRTTAEQRALAADLALLRDGDGMYTADGGLGEPGLYDSAYGLATLALAGASPRLSVDRSWLRAAAADQVNRDPVFGRAYLAMLERTTGTRLHDDGDIAALRDLLTPEGYFGDPTWTSAAAADPGFRLSTTAAAVRALADFGAPLPAADSARVAGWLDGPGVPAATTSLTQRWHLVQADRALGRPPPAGLADAVRDWWGRTGRGLRGAADGDTLVDTCAYVELATAAGVDISAQRGTLAAALRPSRAQTDDLQLGYLVAHAWHTLGEGTDGLRTQRQAITRLRTAVGLLPADRVRHGDLANSAAAIRLRALAGLSTTDPVLAAALRRHHDELVASGTGAAALWALTLAEADPRATAYAGDELRRGTAALVGQPLTLANAQSYAQLAAALRELRLPAPPVQVDVAGWAAPPDRGSAAPSDRATPDQRYARDLAVVALADAGQLDKLPPGEPEARIAARGTDLLRSGSPVAARAALAAAAALGWRPAPADRDRLVGLLRPLRGCPGTPALYRDASTGSCAAQPTLAAWQIYRLVDADPGRAAAG